VLGNAGPFALGGQLTEIDAAKQLRFPIADSQREVQALPIADNDAQVRSTF